MRPMSDLSRDEILSAATTFAATQLGGALATTHAEDGTPYVTFVLFHLRQNGEVLFGSAEAPQHTRNIRATPEVSFLVDNRDVLKDDWSAFDRLVIEGRAHEVPADSQDYAALIDELRAKNRMAAYFTERGHLYRVVPRRLVLRRGFQPDRLVVDFASP